MKLAFSTLACPDWTMSQIIQIASSAGYQAIELRFVEGEDALYKLPAFRGEGLTDTRRLLSDHGLSICCVDTSCRFHFPDAGERNHWIAEGRRMADLAAELGAPAIRVFGDSIQSGENRAQTRQWIADSIATLAHQIESQADVWLETHGDFASSSETLAILMGADSSNTGVIWDPANCWIEANETPTQGAAALASALKHVHMKDIRRSAQSWAPVLTGEGNFPLLELRDSLLATDYRGVVSFEWEKKWHPEIPDASIALPHFATWFRENWK